MYDKSKVRFFRLLGNIVICATVGAVLLLTINAGDANVSVSARQPIYSGKSETKVSLMINVYWGTEYVGDMLDILDRHNAKTTFFVGGVWAVGNPDTLKKIAAAGHEIGNHGYYHKDHKKLDRAYNLKELGAAHDAVKDIIGVDMTLFAPPSGSFGDVALAAAEELGYRSIMWTRDTIDWRDRDSALIFRRAVDGLKGGDLVLMHPTECTVKALDGILSAIAAAGLEVAPVTEVIGNAA